MNKPAMKRSAAVLAMTVGMAAGTALAAGPALVPVLDVANLAVNTAHAATSAANLAINTENAAVNTVNSLYNAAQVVELAIISKQLSKPDKGSVTYNIDKNIEFNTEINQDFTWIINKGDGGDEIIPIPFDLDGLMGGQKVATYVGHYRTFEDHKDDPLGHYGDATAVEASRARKAANDALMHAIASDDEALNEEANALKRLVEVGNKAEGHGRQLQVANALGASQINQLMRLRSLTLISEAARAAETQAAADRDARAIAVGKHMRSGLDSMIQQSIKPAPIY